tara:strand:- start:468 stop:737 length:270 start_codon:yes stop_codon:yes gene_type:complete
MIHTIQSIRDKKQNGFINFSSNTIYHDCDNSEYYTELRGSNYSITPNRNHAFFLDSVFDVDSNLENSLSSLWEGVKFGEEQDVITVRIH